MKKVFLLLAVAFTCYTAEAQKTTKTKKKAKAQVTTVKKASTSPIIDASKATPPPVEQLMPERIETKGPADEAPKVAAQPQVDPSTLIEFKNEDYDFGKIPYGKQAEYTVSLKNITKQPVTLQEVKVGCGCTTPKYEKNTVIQPGATYDVVLGFNGYTEGHFQKVATLVFDNATKVVNFHGETFKTPDTAAPANEAVKSLKPASN